MNTETGEVYERGETERLRERVRRVELERLTAQEREFARADAAGQIVPISDHVAALMKKGHEAQRKAKRKAAKQARKRNR